MGLTRFAKPLDLFKAHKETVFWATRFLGVPTVTASGASMGWAYDISAIGVAIISAPAWLGFTFSTPTINDIMGLTKDASIDPRFIQSWNKRRRFRTSLKISDVSEQITRIGSYGLSVPPADGFGFLQTANGRFYGFVIDDSSIETQLQLMTGVLDDTPYTLEARFYPAQKVEFYINEVLKGSLIDVTKFPVSGLNSDILFTAQAIATSINAVGCQIGYYELWQGK